MPPLACRASTCQLMSHPHTQRHCVALMLMWGVSRGVYASDCEPAGSGCDCSLLALACCF